MRAFTQGQGTAPKRATNGVLGLALLAALGGCREPEARLVRSDYAAGEVRALCEAAMSSARTRLDAIAQAATARRAQPIDSLLAMEEALADLQDEVLPLQFMAYVSTDEGLRDEGSECETKSSQLFVEIGTRKELYDAIRDAKPRNSDERRLLQETLRSFESNGLGLPAEKLARVREFKQKLAGLEAEFSANLNNDATIVSFAEAELEGTSDAFRARLARAGDGRLVATTKSTDYTQVMNNAVRGETRRRMLRAYLRRGGETNVRLLEEAIATRREIAREMGAATWADYQTRDRMAGSAGAVREFLTGLRGKLTERNRSDLSKLLTFKREAYDPNAKGVDHWDVNFLAYQLKKRDFELDDDQVREYFPAEIVMSGMFEVYSKLLDVEYVEVKDAKVWHPDVKLYEVRDRLEGRRIAYFYADYFPRPGKYGHAAAFSLTLGRRQMNGAGYSLPVSAVVANFNPPSGGKPSLLNHDEVETVFHEFGHIMHQLLTRAPFASLAGTAVARDFVEAPSQMLENWVWDAGVLGRISGHYQDRSRKLPTDLLQRMLAAKDFNQGYAYTRQLYFGLMDLEFHTSPGSVDTTAVVNRLHQELFGIPSVEGGLFQAGFGHLMGGYDAGYYGYLWSEVYAQDLFTRFEKEGLGNERTGDDYRRLILERGNMFPALDLVTAFLGRKPNAEAFYRKLGI